jgi:hypothetical protein
VTLIVHCVNFQVIWYLCEQVISHRWAAAEITRGFQYNFFNWTFRKTINFVQDLTRKVQLQTCFFYLDWIISQSSQRTIHLAVFDCTMMSEEDTVSCTRKCYFLNIGWTKVQGAYWKHLQVKQSKQNAFVKLLTWNRRTDVSTTRQQCNNLPSTQLKKPLVDHKRMFIVQRKEHQMTMTISLSQSFE